MSTPTSKYGTVGKKNKVSFYKCRHLESVFWYATIPQCSLYTENEDNDSKLLKGRR